ncbi:hypothetical protein GCM10007291_04130 [Gemmobacter nanjingensis]|uniref:Uncharacterized protein n=1 Tax=Gemmobacter nanjingensis TaxID=488454 RepID=A0ABQ3F703_9RHOB|nr:hypothetical protein GCM10007291_04130 [Gemmobacter nanjingensis]
MHDLSPLAVTPDGRGFGSCKAGLLACGSWRVPAFPVPLGHQWRMGALSAHSRGGGRGFGRLTGFALPRSRLSPVLGT